LFDGTQYEDDEEAQKQQQPPTGGATSQGVGFTKWGANETCACRTDHLRAEPRVDSELPCIWKRKALRVGGWVTTVFKGLVDLGGWPGAKGFGVRDLKPSRTFQ